MRDVPAKYKCLPFWSWNDALEEEECVRQINWMNDHGVGGFFMHARGGLTTPYLGEKWFSCVEACQNRAEELGMEAYAYDENGWPSGFAGGALLEDIENHDRYLTYDHGPYDEKALACYDDSGDKLVRVESGENCFRVYEHYSASTADILNADTVDQFIALTHKQYQKHDPDHKLRGFFTDEPQYYRWGNPYTKAVRQYFEEVYHEDIRDRIGLLFLEKEGYRDFRYKYWFAMQRLMLDNWAKKVYDWCDEHDYKLTGHYVEENSLGSQMMCCAGIMPFYEYEHIPGCDWLGRNILNELNPRQVSSVAMQLGKPQVLTETFACCGWDVTPKEIKWIGEYLYVNGVNLMCQHLMPYSEYGQRKRDYPAHYSPVNPWINKGFKEFNDYFSVLGQMLAESKEVVHVGLLHPIRSCYFDYKRDLDWAGGFGVAEINGPFNQLIEKLNADHIGHHYLDETIMEKHAHVKGDKLVVGQISYSIVILPKMYTMGKFTEALLKQYVSNGGKILLMGEAPTYLEGQLHDYDFLQSNISYEEILCLEEIHASSNRHVSMTLREEKDGRRFIYAVNLGTEKETVTFEAEGLRGFDCYDVLTDSYYKKGTTIVFKPQQSFVLYLSNECAGEEKTKKEFALGKEFHLDHPVDNYLTLDCAKFAKGNEPFGKEMPVMGIFNQLLKDRYQGELTLRYTFTSKITPRRISLLAETTKAKKVLINGVEVISNGVSPVEAHTLSYDIASCVKTGENTIDIVLDYYQGENVYYALFGENVTESLKNCLAYDTDIEAVYLKGEFGVFGEFEQGKNETIVLGSNFYLDKQKEEINDLIHDGYPFFSGDIALLQNVTLENGDYVLHVPGRFQFVEVEINGKQVGHMMWDDDVDCGGFTHAGTNEIKFTLTVGNRNRMGPFHTLGQEEFSIGPYTFERMGTWNEGESPLYKKPYAFVKTII